MILSIGEILYDVFPEYKCLGGAPFNFSFHLKKIGVPVMLVSRVGDDPEGKSILQKLRQMGFETSHIQIDKNHRTGEVLVRFDENGEPDFNILPDVAYDYINPEDVNDIMLSETIGLIYFGSLIQRSEYGFAKLQGVLSSKNPSTKCLYDVNLRPGCYDSKLIGASLKHADILKVNETELLKIKRMLDVGGKSDAAFINSLIERYQIDMVALTRGPKGSDLFTSENHYAVKAPRIEKVNNSVGAGDAYASILGFGYSYGWQPKEILVKATAFAAGICEIDGAIPTNESFYDDWRLNLQ